jgi:hypothetical protein
MKGKDTRQFTHLLLDGGKLCIPENFMNEFYKSYATNIITKQPNYISECKTPIFKMIMDLDFYDDSVKSYQDIKPILIVINGVISEFFPKLEPFEKRMIVCGTEPTEGSIKNNKIFVKQGFGHLIWPDIMVDNNMGMKVRQACIQKLEEKFGARHADNIWEDVVDKTIYKKNGLRMIGSAKIGICKRCKAKNKGDNVDCDVCLGEGKYYQGRIYKVCDIIVDGETDEAELDKLTTDYVYMVKETSIRCFVENTTSFEVPDWVDDFYFEYDDKKTNMRVQKRFYAINNEGITDEDSMGISEFEPDIKARIEGETLIFKTIAKLIDTTMPDVYHNLEIMDIKQCKGEKNEYYLVRVNSSFCMNIADYHKSNTIYFVVTEMGICQKCFCRCDTIVGRKFGVRCAEYHSELKPIKDSNVMKLLFPNSAAANKKVWNRLSSDGGGDADKKLSKDKLIQILQANIEYTKDYLLDKRKYENRFNSKTKKK